MAFQYSCFISYARGESELVTKFMGQLNSALEGVLEPYFTERPFYADAKVKPLAPGMHLDPALAKALCRSVCMIMVYSPTYARSRWCRSEYQTMAALEARRRKIVRDALPPDRGLTIPVLFRGKPEHLPRAIQNPSLYLDVRGFNYASRYSLGKQYAEQIEQMANYIYDVWERLAPQQDALTAMCEQQILELPDWDGHIPGSGAFPMPMAA